MGHRTFAAIMLLVLVVMMASLGAGRYKTASPVKSGSGGTTAFG